MGDFLKLLDARLEVTGDIPPNMLARADKVGWRHSTQERPIPQLSITSFVASDELGPGNFLGIGGGRWELILLRQEF